MCAIPLSSLYFSKTSFYDFSFRQIHLLRLQNQLYPLDPIQWKVKLGHSNFPPRELLVDNFLCALNTKKIVRQSS